MENQRSFKRHLILHQESSCSWGYTWYTPLPSIKDNNSYVSKNNTHNFSGGNMWQVYACPNTRPLHVISWLDKRYCTVRARINMIYTQHYPRVEIQNTQRGGGSINVSIFSSTNYYKLIILHRTYCIDQRQHVHNIITSFHNYVTC